MKDAKDCLDILLVQLHEPVMERDASWTSPARRPFSIEADGCKKLMHMAGQGTAHAAGMAAADQVAKAREGMRVFFGTAMRNSSLLFDQFARVSSAATVDEEPTCSADILASRPTAHAGQGSKDTDRKVRSGCWT